MSTSLHGKKVLITREKNQANEFTEKVLKLGGEPIEVPLLKISCKDKKELRDFHQYRWLFFTSSNGVDCFFRMLDANDINKDFLTKVQFAAVGHKTEDALKVYGHTADFIPSTYNADVMAAEFLATFSSVSPVLFVRGNRSRDVLPNQFSKNNISFDTIEVYETAYNYQSRDMLNDLLMDQDIDFITFTSPSTVEAFIEMKHNDGGFEKAKKTVCVCIGTTTVQKAEEAGFTKTLIPDQFTIEGMLKRIIDYIEKG